MRDPLQFGETAQHLEWIYFIVMVFSQFVKRKIGNQIQKVCGKAKPSLSVAQIISVFFSFFKYFLAF